MKACACLCFSAFLTWLLANPTAIQPAMVVRGTTTFFVDHDDQSRPLDEPFYRPFEGVTVKAWRESPLTETSSKRNGAFRLTDVTPGSPFLVLFYKNEDDQIVPELQQLCGRPPESEHTVHVTLLSVDQFRRLYGDDALQAKLRYTESTLGGLKGREAEELRGFIARIRKRSSQ